jgi:hypothetical protein
MLNWTDLCGLLMMLAGPLSGVAAAHQHKAGIFSLVLFGAFGLAIAFQIGKTSSKLSYRILGSKTLPAGLQFVGYMSVPMISLLLVILIPALIVAMMYGRT